MKYARLVYIRELTKRYDYYTKKRNESKYLKVRSKYIQKMTECKEEKQIVLKEKIIETSNLTTEEKKMAVSYYYDAKEWNEAFETSGLLALLDENCNDKNYTTTLNTYIQRIERYFKN